MTAAKREVSIKGGESWSVGTSQCITDKVDPEKDAPITISVSRHFHGDMPGEGEGGPAVKRAPNPDHGHIRGDVDGRQFDTKEEAHKFLYKRGYTQDYYSQKEPLRMSIDPKEAVTSEATECARRAYHEVGEDALEGPRKEDWHKYIRLVRLRGHTEELKELFKEEFLAEVHRFFQ